MSGPLRTEDTTSIRITVQEDNVMDALLIFRSYACSEYCLHLRSCWHDNNPGRADSGNLAVNAPVEITAKCRSSAVPTLLEEFFAAFGDKASVQAERR